MLTHLEGPDHRPRMVDVSAKPPLLRRARAQAIVELPPEVAARFDGRDLASAKGPVFHTASLAGIQAAKRTSDLIPLCHLLPLDDCRVECQLEAATGRLTIEAEAAAVTRTGVEMEALTAAAVAALTVYDMLKGIAPGLVVRNLRLIEKTKSAPPTT